jgi:hypothetical protein
MAKTAMARDEAIATLRGLGLPDLVHAAEHELPDLVEPEDLDQFAKRHGLTKDWAISRMGGSP